jgi:hypothetical protein
VFERSFSNFHFLTEIRSWDNFFDFLITIIDCHRLTLFRSALPIANVLGSRSRNEDGQTEDLWRRTDWQGRITITLMSNQLNRELLSNSLIWGNEDISWVGGKHRATEDCVRYPPPLLLGVSRGMTFLEFWIILKNLARSCWRQSSTCGERIKLKKRKLSGWTNRTHNCDNCGLCSTPFNFPGTTLRGVV